jgi:hypothetical protein
MDEVHMVRASFISLSIEMPPEALKVDKLWLCASLSFSIAKPESCSYRNSDTISDMNFAASRQVNPSWASPKLTEEQVWKGLEIKTREPKSFVAAITQCEIISDTGNKVGLSAGPRLT